MSHHSKDHKLLAEAYEQITPSPEKPVMETPPADNRKFFKVSVEAIYHCTQEDLADVIRNDLGQVLMEDPTNFTQEVPATDPLVVKGLQDGTVDP